MNEFLWALSGVVFIGIGLFGFEVDPVYGLGAILLGIMCLGVANKKNKPRYIVTHHQRIFRRK